MAKKEFVKEDISLFWVANKKGEPAKEKKVVREVPYDFLEIEVI